MKRILYAFSLGLVLLGALGTSLADGGPMPTCDPNSGTCKAIKPPSLSVVAR
jgi:hypothetical protein